MLFEEFVERRRRDAPVGVRHLEEARERHLPEFVVMSVAFAVGRRYQDAVLSLDGGVKHSLLEGVAVVEQAAEGYVARYAGVVEEYRHRAAPTEARSGTGASRRGSRRPASRPRRDSATIALHCEGASITYSMPHDASVSSVGVSTAHSGSHMPLGSRP